MATETTVTVKGGGVAIVGYHYYGHGADLKEAKKNFREEGGSLSDGYFIYEFPEGLKFLGVSGMGYVEWRNLQDTPGLIPTKTKVKGRHLK
jgi:hypothetical protein